MSDGFNFDLKAKRKRLSDDDLIDALQSVAVALGEGYFTSTQYDDLPGKRPYSATVIERFGSWKKALKLIGITGGRERRYSPEQLIENLEKVWRQLGYPPGKRKIATLGERISDSPYKRHWGSLRSACGAFSAFRAGGMPRERLLAGNTDEPIRTTIPLRVRWDVLKRDRYCCTKCGSSPSNNHRVELEVDHIVPVTKGGGNDLGNLQTLCRNCNQGKKDR